MRAGDYTIADCKILDGWSCRPHLFFERGMVLFSRAHGVQDGSAYRATVAAEFDALADRGAKVGITYGQVEYIRTLCDGKLIISRGAAQRIEETMAYLALNSIAGRGGVGRWVNTNNQAFVARLAGYKTWRDFEAAAVTDCMAEYYTMNPRTMRDRLNKLRQRIADNKALSGLIEFRGAECGRGFDFKIKQKLK